MREKLICVSKSEDILYLHVDTHMKQFLLFCSACADVCLTDRLFSLQVLLSTPDREPFKLIGKCCCCWFNSCFGTIPPRFHSPAFQGSAWFVCFLLHLHLKQCNEGVVG